MASAVLVGAGSFAYGQGDHELEYYESIQTVCHHQTRVAETFLEAKWSGVTEEEVLTAISDIDDYPGLRRTLSQAYALSIDADDQDAFLAMTRVNCLNAYLGQ